MFPHVQWDFECGVGLESEEFLEHGERQKSKWNQHRGKIVIFMNGLIITLNLVIRPQSAECCSLNEQYSPLCRDGSHISAKLHCLGVT